MARRPHADRRYRGSLHLYDVGKRTLGARVSDSYDGINLQGSNCFRPQGGRFAVLPPVVTPRGGMTTTAAPQDQRLRHVPDWSRPEEYADETEVATAWNLNPLDCSRIDDKERARKVAEIESRGSAVRSPRPLVLARDGDAFVSVPRGAGKTGARVLHVSGREVPLPGATDVLPDSNTTVASVLDSDGSYVLYETTSVFDAKRGAWPLTAWRLGPDLATVKVLTVTDGKPAWTQRLKDNFEGGMFVSPDGCRIAYADSERRMRLLSAGPCR